MVEGHGVGSDLGIARLLAQEHSMVAIAAVEGAGLICADEVAFDGLAVWREGDEDAEATVRRDHVAVPHRTNPGVGRPDLDFNALGQVAKWCDTVRRNADQVVEDIGGVRVCDQDAFSVVP